MPAAAFNSVDDYIASQPGAARETLELVRTAIRKAVPAAEEVISYHMPTYKLSTGPVLYFAGWRRHYSVYPASPELIAAFKDDLAPYLIQKSTIRFPLSQPVPVKLIARIAKYRVKELAARVQAPIPSRKALSSR